MIGISIVIAVVPLNCILPATDIAAILNPRYRLPVSPKNIFAG